MVGILQSHEGWEVLPLAYPAFSWEGSRQRSCMPSGWAPMGQAGNASLLTGKPVAVRFPDSLYKCKKARYRQR